MKDSKNFYALAEYASLALSVLGTIAAVASQQIVFAVAPMTLAISLNTINRQRLLQLTQLHTKNLIASVHQTIDSSTMNQSLKKLEHNIEVLSEKFNTRSEAQSILHLTEQLTYLEQHLLTEYVKTKDLTDASTKIRSEFLGQLNFCVKQLNNAIASVPPPPDLEQLQIELSSQIDESISSLASEINQLLKTIQYDYQLIIDRSESRKLLMKALDTACERLIIVSPWLTQYAIDSEFLHKLRIALERSCQIDIGWGHLSDIQQSQSTSATRFEFLKTVEQKNQSWKYNALPKLEQIEREYLGQFGLKLMGTHEKFLVCDQAWAVLGSHNFLASGASGSEREVGLYTNDPRIIASLIERFDDL